MAKKSELQRAVALRAAIRALRADLVAAGKATAAAAAARAEENIIELELQLAG